MNSGEKKARIVWRMKSVDVTRVIPSRCAASVAIVDLPVPVAPPMSRMTGTSSWCSAWSRRSRRIVRPPSSSPRTSAASSPSRSRSTRSLPRSARSASSPPGQVVRTRHAEPGRGERRGPSAPSTRAALRRRPAGAARDSGARSSDRLRHAERRLRGEPLELDIEEGSPGRGTTSFAAITILRRDGPPPRRRRRRRPPSARRRRRRRPRRASSSRSAARSASAPRDERRARAVRVGEVGREGCVPSGGAVQKYATRSPATGSSGRGRRTPRTTGTPARTCSRTAAASSACGASGSAIVTSTRSAIRARKAFR